MLELINIIIKFLIPSLFGSLIFFASVVAPTVFKTLDENKIIVLIPPNFASAHLCMTKKCVFHYKFSYKGAYPDVKRQISFKWNDPKLKIKWPIKKPILSKRDKNSKPIS